MAQPMVTVEGVAPLAPGGTSNPSECDAWQCDSVTVWQCDSVTVWQCVGRRPDFQIFDKELTCSWGLTHNILSSPVKFRVNFSPNSPSPHTAQHGTVRHTLLCTEKPTLTNCQWLVEQLDKGQQPGLYRCSAAMIVIILMTLVCLK